ncbi:MAG TPA: GtrA family protein [Ohtaekwangia sp.]|nr:GtrA family protein [Ohtaekwangia sp.]
MNEPVIEIIIKFLKFGLVGASGLAVDFGLTFLFKEILKLNKYIANAIGFLAAASSNFAVNRMWTFASVDPDITSQYMKFIGVSLVGLVLSYIILKLMHERLNWNFYLAKLIAICIVMSWNFVINFIFTFA